MIEMDTVTTIIDRFLKWFTPVSVIVSIIFFWSADHATLLAVKSRVDAYELHGTPAAVKQQEQLISLEKRLSVMEQMVIKLSSVEASVERCNAKLDIVRERLDEHMKTTGRFMEPMK